jgi:NAD(P)-dependent dehydrogenase (short-subunit alcohol dehydrogenase family)
MKDKPVALVTGANKGIGLQIAKDLAAQGFIVLVGSRNLKQGETAAKSVAADARALQLDVESDLHRHRSRTHPNEFGRLDVLVNNAAISHAGKPGRSLEEIVKAGRATTRCSRPTYSASSPSRKRCCRSFEKRRRHAL